MCMKIKEEDKTFEQEISIKILLGKTKTGLEE